MLVLSKTDCIFPETLQGAQTVGGGALTGGDAEATQWVLDVGAAADGDSLKHSHHSVKSWLAKLVTPHEVASDAPLSTALVAAPAADQQQEAGAEAGEGSGGTASVKALPFSETSSSSSSAGPAPAPGPAPTPAPAPAPGVFTPLLWVSVGSNKDGFLLNKNPTPNPPLNVMLGQYVTFAVDTQFDHPFVLTDAAGVEMGEPDVLNNGEVSGGVLWHAETPGTYKYTCPDHPSFGGTITVA